MLVTPRPAADWYDSFYATISNGIPREHSGDTDETGAMMNEVIVQRSFQDRAGSRKELVARYEEHVAEVRAECPAERLWVWAPGEGRGACVTSSAFRCPTSRSRGVNDRADFYPMFVGGGGYAGG